MPEYVNFNRDGVTPENIDAFYEALAKFANKRGVAAAHAWLFKLNPLAQEHLMAEQMGCDREYTYRMARDAVRFEYDEGPLPIKCECGGIAWYKGTFGATKCLDCGELLPYNEYLDGLLKEKA